jgi:hypothetical protein
LALQRLLLHFRSVCAIYTGENYRQGQLCLLTLIPWTRYD